MILQMVADNSNLSVDKMIEDRSQLIRKTGVERMVCEDCANPFQH